MSQEKMWGSEPYWGLSYDWDPDWMLADRRSELRATLIDPCQQEMRENGKRSDDELKFPRRNPELLGEHGFLALTVPEEYGGLGFKRDMELGRYLRDGKAGWVMGPTNEVLRQFVGKSALLGFEVLDYWNQHVNERAIANETKKLDAKGKRALAEKLLAQAAEDEAKEPIPR